MTIIYVWPPQIGLRQQRYSVVDPVQTSRSLLTGKRYVSAHARRRRVVDFEASTRQRHGYGVMEALISALRGGVNLVRLSWYGPTDVTGARGATSGVWDEAWDVNWESVTGVASGSSLAPGVRLAGLAVSKTVARAGEFIAMGGEVRTLIADVVSGPSGTATALTDSPFTTAGAVTLPAKQSGVFEVTQLPEVPWTWNAEASVNWSFREVHLDEVGAVSELAPWGY